MAGEYGVNIKFRTIGLSQLDKAKAKVKELESSVSNIRSLDLSKAIRGKVGDQIAEATGQIKRYAQQVNKTGKVVGQTQQQQEAAVQAFKNLRSQVKVGGKDFDMLTQAIIRQNKAIDEQNKKLGINQKKRRADPKGRGAALKSGLVSGAFPLLFGQGPLGGAAGFAGGFIGTRMGGQMGGFAGGLAATAILQQLTEITRGLNELGRALDPFTLNIDKVNQSLGLVNTPTGEYLKLLEQTKGRQAAFNAAMAEMEQVVGKDGVQALQNFGEGTKRLQSVFSQFLTRIAATAAKVIAGTGERKPGSIRGFERASLLGEAKKRREQDSELDALFKQLEGRVGSAERERIQNLIISNQLQKEDLDLLKLQELQYEQITASVFKKNEFLEEAIAKGTREATIQEKLREFDEQAKMAKGGILDITSKQHQAERQLFEDALRLQEELQRVNSLYQGIASTIQSGVVDAIEGAINGTKTLGDVARSVFGAIQRQLINFAATSFLRSIPGIGGFFANGGVTKPNKSYIVGERGPELFTPGVTGRVTPNHEMGGGSTSIVVNVDASGSSVEGDEESGRELGLVLSAAIESELIKQKRPGGLLA